MSIGMDIGIYTIEQSQDMWSKTNFMCIVGNFMSSLSVAKEIFFYGAYGRAI